MADKWLRLDEVGNAIDNLEMVAHFLGQLDSERKWKWIIIAGHQALYGFAICCIQGTDPQRVIDPKSKPPNERLISIWEAIKRCKNPDWLPFTGSRPLNTSPAENDAIQKLVETFRNEFEHFTPKHWSIEVSGMPALLEHLLRVVRFLALESDSITYHDDQQEFRISQTVTRISDLLARESAA